jgi:hypothetical protein
MQGVLQGRIRMRWLAAILLLSLGGTVMKDSVVDATVLDVFPDGSGPYPVLQSALAAFEPGDSIRLADGIFTGPGNRNLILGNVELTLFSASGNPQSCVLDLERDGRGFLIYSTLATAIRIEGITLRSGDPRELPEERLRGYGGGLAIQGFVAGGSVHIDHCIFEDNVAEAGGGAFLYEAQARFDDCVFRRNIATDGAGVYCGQCNAGDGVEFFGCLLHDNDYPYPSVGGYGAGVYYSHSVGAISSCTFARNSAWLGGGLLISTASSVGVENSLFAFATEGEGLAVFNPGAYEITRCDIFGNAGGDWIGQVAGHLGVDCNMSEDPVFCDAQAGDFTLRDDSPCLFENNDCGLIGAFPQGCTTASALRSQPNASGELVDLNVLSPCVAGGAIEITFSLRQAGSVRLQLFDVGGRCVATLIDGPVAAGAHRLPAWRPHAARMGPLASGAYLLRLEAAGNAQSRRVIVVR